MFASVHIAFEGSLSKVAPKLHSPTPTERSSNISSVRAWNIWCLLLSMVRIGSSRFDGISEYILHIADDGALRRTKSACFGWIHSCVVHTIGVERPLQWPLVHTFQDYLHGRHAIGSHIIVRHFWCHFYSKALLLVGMICLGGVQKIVDQISAGVSRATAAPPIFLPIP
jgi:hypothetical protein